eukprot:11525242-Alexandrium_andersonii.AAC.1
MVTHVDDGAGGPPAGAPGPLEECLLSRRAPGVSSPRSCACRVCAARRLSPRAAGEAPNPRHVATPLVLVKLVNRVESWTTACLLYTSPSPRD